ncbi:hypothetical protein CERSUDRAFT_121695 [Gelatoporia subvermispora B]|uniref:Uncharacterized protein n=1 Tax=Ceriporiopsis subvermispora (strain B) TaxID=914234 RepID=M2RRT4_CERS8|nr:hypothetical protein CERSUDRAFT_121695 [Gelatoporia subvermispora B]
MSEPQNPDRRELPPGWISQYDSNYKAWFYVNTRDDPPRPSWVHPLGPPRPTSSSSYRPPAGPPPPDRPYDGDRGYSPQPQRAYSPQPPRAYSPNPPQQQDRGFYAPSYGQPQGGYNLAPPQQYGGYAPPPPAAGYGQPPPQVVYAPTTIYENGPPRPNYYQPPPQQVVEVIEVDRPRHHFGGGGLGLGLAAGGVGLLGGALIADAIVDDRIDNQLAFDQGFIDGEIADGGFW